MSKLWGIEILRLISRRGAQNASAIVTCGKGTSRSFAGIAGARPWPAQRSGRRGARQESSGCGGGEISRVRRAAGISRGFEPKDQPCDTSTPSPHDSSLPSPPRSRRSPRPPPPTRSRFPRKRTRRSPPRSRRRRRATRSRSLPTMRRGAKGSTPRASPSPMPRMAFASSAPAVSSGTAETSTRSPSSADIKTRSFRGSRSATGKTNSRSSATTPR